MKYLKYIILFILASIGYGADSQFTLNEFGGKVDFITPDKVQDKYAYDTLNCYTDELGMVVKRRGYTKYNTTALPGAQNIKKLYTYSLSNGDSYIIVNSSTSMFYSNGDGSFTSIISTLTSTAVDDYVVGSGILYRDNGVDTPGKWDASTKVYTPLTVLNSTSMVSGKYIEYFRNRKFVAGITGQENYVYYSEVAMPDYILGYLPINKDDGDWITSIYKFGDMLWVFKRYSIWQIIESSPGVFTAKNVSNKIGCLYDTTVDEYKGFPIFVSHRGVELYDGQFNLVSESIDNYVKGLRQLNLGQGAWTQDTATDWGAGSGVNIDTTTYSGSVAINTSSSTYTNTTFEEAYLRTSVLGVPYTFNFREKIIPAVDTIMKDFQVFTRSSAGTSTSNSISFNMGLYDSTMTKLKEENKSYSYGKFLNGVLEPVLDISTFTLTANSTYYLVVSSPTVVGSVTYSIKISTSNSSFMTSLSSSTSLYSGWEEVPSKHLRILYSTVAINGSYSSQVKQALSWGSWGLFNKNETQPANSTLAYGVKTSTASDNFSTRFFIPVANGAIINSSVGPYIQVISSFTRTTASAVPMVNDFTINWSATTSDSPAAIVHKDRYHLFVSTDSSGDHTYNDIDLVYQKNGEWTIFNGIYSSANTIYRGSWLSGNSNSNGFVYTQDVDNLYTDNGGSAYGSYWISKPFDMGAPINEKLYKTLWVTAENSGNWNLNVDYRLDGYSSTFSTGTVSLSGTNKIISAKYNMPLVPKSRYIQLRIGNNNANEFYRVKRLDLIHEILPLQ